MSNEFGKMHFYRRFCFTKNELKLSEFPDDSTIHGWKVTPELLPPVVSRLKDGCICQTEISI